MIEQIEKNRDQDSYKAMALFVVLILIKLSIFHYLINLKENFIAITIKNSFMVVGVYGLASFARPPKRMKTFLRINWIFSVLFFIDTMYYSHFFTLIPFHSIYQIGQLGPVSSSIKLLVRPLYFLFFIDCIFLHFYYKNNDRELEVLKNNGQRLLIALSCLAFLSAWGVSYHTSRMANGLYTPYNLGMINYHFYDILRFINPKPLLIEGTTEVIERMEQENPGQKIGFGMAKGKNVIVIQAESLQHFVLNRQIEDQWITPVLNSLIQEDSIYFSRYYEQVGWGNTSDAEFVSHNSLYPSSKVFTYKAYENNEFVTLPLLLKERGYSTLVFHGNEKSFWNREQMYPAQGFDQFVGLEDLEQDELIGMGLGDTSLFRQSISSLRSQKQPFYSFYITLTSHHPYVLEEGNKGLAIKGEYKDTLLENYLQTIHYLDRSIGILIEELKKEGLYENAVIVIYGDHEGLDMRNDETNTLLSSFLEKPYREDEMFRVPMIVHIPNSGYTREITTVGGQVDFFPTLANLLGLDIKDAMLLGKDLLNTKEGFVAQQIHLARGSFIDDEKIFVMSKDGIFENGRSWSIETGEILPQNQSREGYERAIREIGLSEYILEYNLPGEIRKNGKGILTE